MHKWMLVAAIICVFGVLVTGILWIFVSPFLEWSEIVENIVQHAERLKIHGLVKVNNTFIERSMIIDRSCPKFQTVLNLISRSSFVRKWDIPPPYAISHEITFYLDNGQQIHLAHDNGTLWWKGVIKLQLTQISEKC